MRWPPHRGFAEQPLVYTWGLPQIRSVQVDSTLSKRHGYDFNGTFVHDPAGNLCIDPVEPGEEILSHSF